MWARELLVAARFSLFLSVSRAFVMADAPILADGAAAVPLEGGEDWSVVQEAAFVDAGGVRTLALARVGVFPGPRAAARLKNVTHLFAALQPSIDMFDAEPKPLLADVYYAARGGGGENAVAHERGLQAVVVAAMEYLFSREKCGGMRVAPGKAVCLPSVYSAASREADSGARGGAASSPSAPEAAAAAATGAGETAGGAQGAEDGAKKRAHSEMEDAVDAAHAAASGTQAEKGPSETGGQPLFAVPTTVQVRGVCRRVRHRGGLSVGRHGVQSSKAHRYRSTWTTREVRFGRRRGSETWHTSGFSVAREAK